MKFKEYNSIWNLSIYDKKKQKCIFSINLNYSKEESIENSKQYIKEHALEDVVITLTRTDTILFHC